MFVFAIFVRLLSRISTSMRKQTVFSLSHLNGYSKFNAGINCDGLESQPEGRVEIPLVACNLDAMLSLYLYAG